MSSAQPRILLLGASGQLGRELAAVLPACGPTVARDRRGLDLTDPDAIARAVRDVQPAFIVNAAAYTEVDRAEDARGQAFAVNATAPGVLAEEARRAGAVLVHYSTDYVFDGERTTPYDEDARPNPQNVYGESKLAGERAIAQARASALILRTSWVYSRTGRNFLTTMERLARERDELRVVADQTGVPNWTRALARITAALIARGRDDLVRHAEAAGFALEEATDLTPWLELGRPRDRAIALFVALFGWLPLARTPIAHVVGGSALQTSLARGWIGYHLVSFRRSPPHVAGVGPAAVR